MGVGSALMEFVEDVAIEMKAELLTVQPDKEAEGFYRKLGFSTELFSGTVLWIPAGRGMADVEAGEFGWDDVKNLELVAGRFQSSYSMFFSAFKDNIAGIHYTVEAGTCGNSYYVLRNLPGKEGIAMLLWGRLEDVRGVVKRAGELGYRRVLTVLSSGIGSFGAQKVGKVKILGKNLT